MDPESKKMLQDITEVVEENNKLLRKVRGVQKRQTLGQVFKMLLIISIALGSFYFLEPYVNKLINVFNSISGTKQSIDPSSLEDILKKL